MLYAGEPPAFAAALIQRESRLLGIHLNDGYGRRDDGLMAGTVNLVQTLELLFQLGPKGIRVNAVAPGMVDTDIRGDMMSQEIFNKILSPIPMGRIASPHEVASVFLFLASDLSSFVTGATIDANGGCLSTSLHRSPMPRSSRRDWCAMQALAAELSGYAGKFRCF